MRPRRLLNEQSLLLLLSFAIAVTSWYYVVSTQNPRVPRTTTKLVAVIPEIAGEPAYGYSLLGVRVTPPTITVSGTPERLAEIEMVRTEPVDITGKTADVVREVGLAGPPDVVRPLRVRVAVQIAPAMAARVVAQVRVRVENTPNGLGVRVDPAVVDVQVEGPVAIVSRLRSTDLVARVDGTDFSEGRRRAALQVEVPAQVRVLSIRPSTVLVVIRKGS